MWDNLFDRAVRQIIRSGTLIVEMPDGSTRRYGDGTGNPVKVTLTEPELLRKLLLNPELHVGEAYMDGTLVIEDDDLYGFLGLVLSNVAEGNSSLVQHVNRYLRRALRVVRQYNPVGRAKANVAHHYDLSGELYELFLDEDRQYSCAYFRSPDDTLEQAQKNKKAHIARKLLIEPGMRVLDIGCGWGGLALTLAQEHGARVLGVTLSEEQHKVACARARAAGLDDRVEFRLTDYRNVKERFDRIVSVGMFEHVGVPHYREFFAHVRDKLEEDGVALLHTIGRSSPPGATNPWIDKYIFPGGYIPAMSEVMAAIEKEDLITTDVEILRLHYAETLKHWHDRFMANRDRVLELYDERFCRMWRFYLVASELTFRLDRQVVFQFQLSRKLDTVPLTRDYIYRDAEEVAAKSGKRLRAAE
ncbi:cyclopropane-fatty-acyl-phospholipid synthase [Meinhardsimonia xiamenensis]|jgi:cyclopropane-fatty-acyl-phospholipid synthase|uniref:Cyclopropane-fatty-acyl-phospholipid synthase n=1 Tax=Meinhardsimonia xiamenensis TaxID=990712 RepID=A0A1G9EKA5_9RHOB|nr:cyclopropane-fatty-acyl-phospholipid synthase family protein [Meinhardsimonia xiamenensis]PRX33732.1 cyclopropane-fatty-acyl-phospholipid synthase [Meinhardsimonia xiamenensis]SDK76529.1 cyclopropane-fatty-acyl-phospholipid synthase [Meinhardsimonia xiamenensis]